MLLMARAGALAFLVLGLMAVLRMVQAAPGEDWLRTLARGLFAAVLLGLSHVTWRVPAGLPQRFRRRTVRLLSMLARPETQAGWAESTPQVGLAEAFADDWTALARQRAQWGPRAFSAAEMERLAVFDAALEAAGPALLRTPSLGVRALQATHEWQALCGAARSTLAALSEAQGRGKIPA
jgi:hypothetical protein